MCETRIENAAKSVDGVTSADWNRETKMLTIEYDTEKVSLDDVHKKIAEEGHDTEKFVPKMKFIKAFRHAAIMSVLTAKKPGK
jgi:copper chaperone CopZ